MTSKGFLRFISNVIAIIATLYLAAKAGGGGWEVLAAICIFVVMLEPRD